MTILGKNDIWDDWFENLDAFSEDFMQNRDQPKEEPSDDEVVVFTLS